jgi:uncharacterized cupin superfamily protein
MAKVIDPADVPARVATGYPPDLQAKIAGRAKRALGDLLGLKNFGVNLTTIPPKSASALRHYHARQDEFVYIVSGTPTLVTDDGRQTLQPGMCAGFPAGEANGHCLVNETDQDVVYLEVGDRTPGDSVVYPDDDLQASSATAWTYRRKDGTAIG